MEDNRNFKNCPSLEKCALKNIAIRNHLQVSKGGESQRKCSLISCQRVGLCVISDWAEFLQKTSAQGIKKFCEIHHVELNDTQIESIEVRTCDWHLEESIRIDIFNTFPK